MPLSCLTGLKSKISAKIVPASTKFWPVSIHSARLDRTPDLIGCNAAAIEVIKTVRPEVSDVPYLAKTATKDTEAPTGSAKKERERRLIERELYEGLSKLYPRGPKPWARSQLLSRCKWERIRHIGNIPLTHVHLSDRRLGKPPCSPELF